MGGYSKKMYFASKLQCTENPICCQTHRQSIKKLSITSLILKRAKLERKQENKLSSFIELNNARQVGSQSSAEEPIYWENTISGESNSSSLSSLC